MSNFPSWPAWRYRFGESRIFASAEEVEAAGDGWVDSPAKVVAPEVVAVIETVEPEGVAPEVADDLDKMDKAALFARAQELGIEGVDGRTGRAKLIDAIRETLGS